ncbi:MAG: extracellular solute-binding protein [Lachnospiraceae bacterium]|nr:extracellular solute-binding protein [Lachnospiraceae bacterium]
MKRFIKQFYVGLIFFFLYVPIAVLFVLSFNDSLSRVHWGGFTLKWYTELVENAPLMDALVNTLLLAVASAGIATILGLAACIGMTAMKHSSRQVLTMIAQIPMLNADVVTGIALMLLLARFMNLSFGSVLIAHITFNLPYVILNILPKLKQIGTSTYEAALDLGASPAYAFFKIVLPEIFPGVLTGFLLAFTMSLDDFSVTYFTKGPGFETLSTTIYGELRKGIKPQMYALSTLMFLVVLLILFIINRQSVKEERKIKQQKKKHSLSRTALCLMLFLLPVTLSGCGKQKENYQNEITVFNYSEYIDPEVLEIFEEETGIHVNYEEFATNEAMYAKLSSDAVSYDLLGPSDYMIEKLMKEGRLQKIDKSKIPNLKNLKKNCLESCESFDPGNEYAVPEFWGTLGLLYNTKMISETEVSSWDCLFDEKNKGNIIMSNDMRNSIGIALKKLGYSINSSNPKEIKEATDLLIRQKPLVQAYLTDETRDELVAENAAIGVIYSGEAYLAMEYNEDLAYSVPEEGSNVWFDCFVMPKDAPNKEGALKFLNFMLREDIASMNFEYVYYTTPNQAVIDSQPDDIKYDDCIFPTDEMVSRGEPFTYLGAKGEKLYSESWKRLKSR